MVADTATEHPAGEIARKRLMTAVADLDLTESEMRTLHWLMRWEPRTLDNVASMIEKARQHGDHTRCHPQQCAAAARMIADQIIAEHGEYLQS